MHQQLTIFQSSRAFDDLLPILVDDSSNGPGSSQSNIDATLSERSAIDEESVANSQPRDSQGFAIHCERDTTLNRIQVRRYPVWECRAFLLKKKRQRRRTQNRNSQRVYRQRRIDERRHFEARAIAAEETSRQMEGYLSELQAMVTSLRHKVQQLEAENLALRTSTYSMPWRKTSLQF